MVDFRSWARDYFLAEPSQRSAMLERGKTLAEAHTAALGELIPNDPQAALDNAVPMVVRQDLPSEITDLLEERVNQRGELAVIATAPVQGQTPAAPSVYRTFKTADGESRRAYPLGKRAKETTLSDTQVNGIAAAPSKELPKRVVIAENRVRQLEVGERPDPAKQQSNTCPVSGKSTQIAGVSSAPITDETPAFVDATTTHYVCFGGHIKDYGDALAQKERAKYWAELTRANYMTEGGTGGAQAPFSVPTSWTTGNRKVLFIRLTFPDHYKEPCTEQEAYETMRESSDYMMANSYGRTYFTTTVTPLLVLTRTHAWLSEYEDNGGDAVGILYQEARRLAKAAGYDTDQFDLDIVRWDGSVGDFGGAASVGGKFFASKQNHTGVFCHELGHNFGLMHSNFWSTNPPSIIGPGTSYEYGNSYDVMGDAGRMGHYVAPAKNQLGWIERNQHATITQSGTYQIYQIDQAISDPAKRYALRVRKDVERDYWWELRTTGVGTSDPWLDYGLLGTWDKWGASGAGDSGSPTTGSNAGPLLLDFTPGSGGRGTLGDTYGSSTKFDAALVVGRTFSDTEAGIHVTPTGKVASTPPSMNVVVNFGAFAGNNAPTQSVTPSTSSVGTNVAVNFTSTATDVDGDVLAYAWDFGDGTFSTNNASTQSKQWSTAGVYVVRCTVSDMKGKLDTRRSIITVGSPTTFTISGRVTGPGGVPIEGVPVANQALNTLGNVTSPSTWRGSYTDNDGYYTITNLTAGTHTLTASLYPYTFTAGFSNPVTVGPNATNMDFTGTELPTVSIAATDATATEASTTTGTFRISRTGSTAAALSVQVLTAGGTASKGADYTLSPEATVTLSATTYSIPIGASFLDITLTPVNDSASEGIETAIMTVPNTAAGYRVSGPNEAIITITDDESTQPVVSLTAVDTLASEPSDGASFLLTRTGDASAALTVNLAYTGTAVRGSDYNAPLSVSIPSGSSSATLNVTVLNDTLNEGNETVTISLGTDAAYQRSTTESTFTFDLNDDDIATVSIAATDADASESGDPGLFTITRAAGDLSRALTVDYAINGTALHGTDYMRLDGRAVIPANETSTSIRISPLDDSIGEGPQTVVLQLRYTGEYLVGSGTGSATVTITDNDLPTVSILRVSDGTYGEASAEPSTGSTWGGSFRINRPAGGAAMTVNYTVSGTATLGTDYTLNASGSVSFTAGQTSKTIDLTVLADANLEDAESIILTLTSGSGYQLDSFATSATSLILDDDQPNISITSAPTDASATQLIAPESTASMRFFVSRSGPTTGALTVNYTMGGTATSGVDYTGATGSVVIPAGEVGEYVTLTVIDDALVESTETVTMSLAAGSYGARVASATVWLTDNEAFTAATTGFASATSTYAENAGAITIPVTLTGTPGGTVKVDYKVTGGSATGAGVDYTLATGTLTYAPGETSKLIPVSIVADILPEEAETIVVSLLNPVLTGLGNTTHTLTITDLSRPESFTGSPSSVLATTATLNGTAIPHGLSTSAYFEWGTTTAYGNTTSSQALGSGQVAAAASQSIGSLTTGATYHYRLVATNAGGTSYGNDRILTTTTQPAPVTLAVTNRTNAGATLNGTVNPNTLATNAWFQWGTTTSYGSTTSSQAIGNGGTAVAVNAGITGLSEGQTYHYRVVANNGGVDVYGEDQSFVAVPYEVAGALYVNLRATHASAASSSWSNLATLGGSFAEQGDTTLNSSVSGTGVPGVLFDGSTTAYTGPETVDDIDGSNDRSMETWVYNPASEGNEEAILNLGRRDAQWAAQFALVYQRSTAYGAVIDWAGNTGWDNAFPKVGTWHHIAATYDNGALILYVDGSPVITKSLGYQLNTLRNAIAVGSQLTSGGVPASSSYRYSGYINSIRIHGGVLSPAQVAANYAFGPDQGSAPPSVALSGASNLTTTTATLNALVNPQGSSASTYFQWGTTTSYGNTTSAVNLVGGPQIHSAPITGLTGNTVYHFRVVTTNASGTTNGPDTLFRPAGYANAGIVEVDLRAVNATAGTATWENTAALGSFTEAGNPVFAADVAGTGFPGVSFNGSTDAYSGPSSNDDLDAASDRSIEVWFYNPSAGTEETLVSLGRRGSYQQNFALLCQPGTSYGAVTVWANDIEWPTGPSAGAWHHAAVVYDGARSIKVYLDGALANSRALGADLTTLRDLLVIGNQRNSNSTLSSQWYSGSLNSVRVHGGALSDAQILANYNLGPELPGGGASASSQTTTLLLADRATLSATVSPNGSATTVYYEYGTDTSYGSQTSSQVVTGPIASQTITAQLTGLTTGVTYHYRIVMVNTNGTTYGPDQTFTPTPLAVAGTLYVNLHATNGSAGQATWGSSGTLAGFTEVGNPVSTASVASTGIPGVLFDGSNDSYTGPQTIADIHGASDRTIEVWAYQPAASGTEPMVHLGTEGPLRGQLALSNGDYQLVQHWGNGVDINWYETSLAAPPANGVWRLYTYVYEGGSTARVYQDGVLIVNKDVGGTLATRSGFPIRLGAGTDFNGAITSYKLSGYLNTVRIHGGVLTPAQVARNYQYGPAVAQQPPEAFTYAATTVLDDRFTANASIEPNGQATTAWIEYGPTTSYGSKTAHSSLASGAAPQRLAGVVFGTSGTTYHYRVVAQNASGTVYGDDMTATLGGLAGAGTLYVDIAATQSGAGTATWPNLGTLGGNFSQIGTPSISSNVASTAVPGVELNGTDNGYYGPASVADITADSDRTVEVWAYNPGQNGNVEILVDLSRNTNTVRGNYTACMGNPYAQFLGGGGEDVFWSSAPTAAAWHHMVYVYDGATTIKVYVDGVLAQTKGLAGALVTNTAPITLGGLRIGSGGTQVQWAGGFGFSGYINSVRVHGGQLNASQIAQNYSAGPAAPLAPYVQTQTSTGSPLSGSVNPKGLATNAWFEYGTTTAYGVSTSSQSIGSGVINVAVTQAVSGLTPNTLYHFRVVAQNSAGISQGNDQTFTTPPAGLASLTLNSGTLSPAFATGTLAYNATVSSTTENVTVTPTQEITGSSITVNGNAVLSGAASSNIPLTIGSNTITVVVTNNGTRTYTVTVKRETPYETYLTSNGATGGGDKSPAGDYDGDGVSNLAEWAFGLNPNANDNVVFVRSGATLTTHGMPAVNVDTTPTTVEYTAQFVRRKDFAANGLIYTAQFSADLVTWQTSNATPVVVATDTTHEVVSVPYPFFINGKKARFFRITVSTAP